jgi:putative ABC transport system substrate-binding protein
VGALQAVPNEMLSFAHKRVADAALAAKLPSINALGYADAGGLMAYGTPWSHVCKLAAGIVDKILKGAKPADLPVQQAAEFELVVNMKTAKALGIAMPGSVMVSVNRVIE